MCNKMDLSKVLDTLRSYPFFEKMLMCQQYAQDLMNYDHLEILPNITKNIVLPWEIESFAQLSIFATGDNPYKSFNNENNDFADIITTIRNYLPPHLENLKNTPHFANDYIMAVGMLQFKCQKNILNRLYRYDYFWKYRDNNIDMPAIFTQSYQGLSYDYFIELAFAIYFFASLDTNIATNFGIKNPTDIFRYICYTHNRAVNLLSIKREEYILRQTEKNNNDITNAVYGFNYLYPYPFIEFQGNTYLPIPYLIIDSITESLVTRATNSNNRLRECIGKFVAQAYVEHIFKDNNIYEEVIPEKTYKKGNQKIDAPDVMIKDHDRFCFIDSKLSTPKLSLRNFNETDISNTIQQYAKNIQQIYNRIIDFENNLYYPFSSKSIINKSNIFGIVVVFESSFVSHRDIYAEVFKDLRINENSDEAKFILSNISITELSDIENITFSSYNVFCALEHKRDNSARWYDMGLFSDYIFDVEPQKLPSILKFEAKTKKILTNFIADLYDKNLIPKNK